MAYEQNGENFDDSNLAKTMDYDIQKTFKFERPGLLVNHVQLIINTIDAEAAFSGRGVKGGIGLLQFSKRMAEIWGASENDDPYADLYLLKTHGSLMKLRNELAVSIQDYTQQLNKFNLSGSFMVSPFVSEKPLIKTLWFKTPYGYMAAQLVADFDKLVRTVITAKSTGLVLDRPYEFIREAALQKIMALFKLPFRWQDLEIKRSDIKANTVLAQEAKQKLGKLPEKIVAQKLHSPFAPMIKFPTGRNTELEPPEISNDDSDVSVS